MLEIDRPGHWRWKPPSLLPWTTPGAVHRQRCQHGADLRAYIKDRRIRYQIGNSMWMPGSRL